MILHTPKEYNINPITHCFQTQYLHLDWNDRSKLHLQLYRVFQTPK